MKEGQVPYSQNFIFFLTYEWAQKPTVLYYSSSMGLLVPNSLAYWAHLYVTKNMKCSKESISRVEHQPVRLQHYLETLDKAEKA